MNPIRVNTHVYISLKILYLYSATKIDTKYLKNKTKKDFFKKKKKTRRNYY
jgi:hypothetical protein